MAKEVLNKEMVNGLLEVIHFLPKFPHKKVWIDYDEETDVLYISLRRPQKATDTDTEMTKNGILLRCKGDELVGITILDASKR